MKRSQAFLNAERKRRWHNEYGDLTALQGSEVERYKVGLDGYMKKAQAGEWNRHEDYAALQVQLQSESTRRINLEGDLERVELERDRAEARIEKAAKDFEAWAAEEKSRIPGAGSKQEAEVHRGIVLALERSAEYLRSQSSSEVGEDCAQCPNTEHEVGPHELGAEGHVRDKGPSPCQVCVAYVKGSEWSPTRYAALTGCPDCKQERCPDDGACHHDCRRGECWRVHNAAPLSGFGEDWPPEIVRASATRKLPPLASPSTPRDEGGDDA